MKELARTLTEWGGLALAASALFFWPPHAQLAVFAAGLMIAVLLHPVAHTAIEKLAVGTYLTAYTLMVVTVLLGRGIASVWPTAWRVVVAIPLMPLAALWIVFVGLMARKESHA